MIFSKAPTENSVKYRSKDGRFEALAFSFIALAYPFIALGSLCLRIGDFAKSFFSKPQDNEKKSLAIKKSGISVLSGLGSVIISPLTVISLTIRGLLAAIIHPAILLKNNSQKTYVQRLQQ